MKKLLALVLSVLMVFSVLGAAFADVDAASIEDQPEFQAMKLGNLKYGEDYTSLYEQFGSKITIADVEEDKDTGFAYLVVP